MSCAPIFFPSAVAPCRILTKNGFVTSFVISPTLIVAVFDPVPADDTATATAMAATASTAAISGSRRITAETRGRVEKAISDLGYVPSRLARGLSAQRTGTLALIVPDVANPFFTLIVRGAEDVARRAGYGVILRDTRPDLDLEPEAIEDLIPHRVAGMP